MLNSILTADQIEDLKAPLSRSTVKVRQQGGRDVSYVESWHVIAEANRIFGFDGWSSETAEVKCVAEREREIGQAKRPGWGVTYIATVRITLGTLVREDVGAGHGIDTDLGQAHESAIKEAVSDAQKRALRMFGNVFGLALYDKTQANVADEADIAYQRFIESCKATIAQAGPDFDLASWFKSETEKKKRSDFGITRSDFDMLVAMVTAKLDARMA